MVPPSFLRRKKEAKKKEEKAPESAKESLLDELCKGDTELFSVLSYTVLLNPSRLSEERIETYIEKAQRFEGKEDFLRARINYQAAGKMALHEGKLKQAQEYFKKCAKLESSPEYKKIFSYFSKNVNAEKALKIAQEYYTQTAESVKRKKA